MGETADQKMKEIAETRERLEGDIRELEERMPSPMRSAKKVLGAVATSSIVLGFLAARRRKKKTAHRDRSADIAGRVGHADEAR